MHIYGAILGLVILAQLFHGDFPEAASTGGHALLVGVITLGSLGKLAVDMASRSVVRSGAAWLPTSLSLSVEFGGLWLCCAGCANNTLLRWDSTFL